MSWFSDLFNDISGKTAERDRAQQEAIAKQAALDEEAARQRAETEAKAQADQARATQEQQAKTVADAENKRIQDALAKKAADEAERRRIEGETAAAAAARRAGAITSARDAAIGYYKTRGVDPSGYASNIDQAITQALAGMPPNETDVTKYLKDIGATTYQNDENARRTASVNALNQTFVPSYAETKIPDTFDDPYIANTLKTQRATADEYIQNMLKRRIVNPVGAAAGEKNLDEQTASASTRLGGIGEDLIGSGRDKLRSIGDRGKLDASSVGLGTPFDTGTYTGQADQAFNDFVGTFGDKFKTNLGDSPLFDTSGLAAVAGMGQRPQNLAFDPAALAGDKSQDDSTLGTGTKTKKRLVF